MPRARQKKAKRRQEELQRIAALANKELDTAKLPPAIATRIEETASDSGAEIIKQAVRSWIIEEFPLHLTIDEFAAIEKRRKLTPAEKAVLYVHGFMHSKDDSKKAIGLRIWLSMLQKNLAMQAANRRMQPKTVVPENCRPNEDLSLVNAKSPEVYAPVKRYRLVLPDNGRGPNRGRIEKT